MTKGIKFDGEKPDYSLLPPYAIDELAKLLSFGAKKYAPNNWHKVKPKKRYYAAAGRHLFQYLSAVISGNREDQYDSESGIHHLICVACNCMFLYEHEAVHSKDEPFYGDDEKKSVLSKVDPSKIDPQRIQDALDSSIFNKDERIYNPVNNFDPRFKLTTTGVERFRVYEDDENINNADKE